MRLPVLRRKQELLRSDPFVSLEDWANMWTQFAYNGSLYTVPGQAQEEIAPNFSGLARVAYKTNGVVFACLQVRQMLLAEARFCFRERRNGRPGNLFTNASLAPLESPWQGATTGDLISRMELHASLAGNWFGTSRYGGVRTLRPDWVTIVIGSTSEQDLAAVDPDAEVVGYVYEPGGRGSGRDPVTFLAEEVAHYAPIPDPEARFRGMSWLTPIIREIMSDKAATDHKLKFFENAATPNLHVSIDVPTLDDYDAYVRKFREHHESVGNAYRTLFTTKAVDVTAVGANLQQMDFKATQGAGETRIAAAAGVPPVVVGLSEGLQGSSLNAGNFEASMARLRDVTIRPLLRNMAGSLETLVPAPGAAELWYDDRDVPAFQEDIKKAGERLQAQTASMSSLISAGYEPDSVTDAVVSGDLSRLIHSGLTSVQLLPPGSQPPGPPETPAEKEPAPVNGNGKRSDDLLAELLRVSRERDAQRPIEIRLEQEPAQITVPVTVEAAEPQHITVEAARAPDVNVTVEPASVTVEPAQVTVEAAPTPNVDVRVDAPPPAEVNVTVEPSTVTVEAAPAPDVYVDVHLPEQQRPRNARAKREEDGSLTVSYDDEETT